MAFTAFLSAKISALSRLSVNFFQLRLTKRLKINFFCPKELNIHKPVFFLTFKQNKGRTIRKVMGGGGEFSSCKNFFSLSDSLHEFYLGHCMNIF